MPESPFRHTHSEHKPHHLGGDHYWFRFANGYGASVVRFSGSYGGNEGLWEVAVLSPGGGLDYSTPVTNDVLGWLTPQGVDEALDAIDALPTPCGGDAP